MQEADIVKPWNVAIVASVEPTGILARILTTFCPLTASAFAAVAAEPAVSALATESPGAALLICFFAIFLTFDLLILLEIASGPAIAVPATAKIRATTATAIAAVVPAPRARIMLRSSLLSVSGTG